MARAYEIKHPLLREWWKKYESVFLRYGYYQVFDGFMTMMINFFADGKFKEERDQKLKGMEKHFHVLNQMHTDFIHAFFRTVERGTDQSWFDFFGVLYESFIASGGNKKYFAQFFTPEPVCDLIAKMTYGDANHPGSGKGPKSINDPCSGSGRILIAGHMQWPMAYGVASDLDIMCCKMTVLNMYLHGMRGEVVHKDALNLGDYKRGWRIRSVTPLDTATPLFHGMPIIEELPKEQSLQWYGDKVEMMQSTVKKEMTEAGKPVPRPTTEQLEKQRKVQEDVVSKREKEIPEQIDMFGKPEM